MALTVTGTHGAASRPCGVTVTGRLPAFFVPFGPGPTGVPPEEQAASGAGRAAATAARTGAWANADVRCNGTSMTNDNMPKRRMFVTAGPETTRSSVVEQCDGHG
ncbi:hypothetical protein [Streptomyces sp. NPDC005017]|uniref:hypothetical protein n=1 Tax=Streptomyces sp. NPDC005017 TaxID=3364706 RepID=UPI003683ECA0